MAIEVKSARSAGRLVHGAKIKGGCVCLAPGAGVGEHSTGTGEEVLLVLEGEATVIACGEARKLGKDECAFIPEGTTHNVLNGTEKALVYVYFVAGKESRGGS